MGVLLGGGLYLVSPAEPGGPWEQLLEGGQTEALELHLVWTEISFPPNPPTGWAARLRACPLRGSLPGPGGRRDRQDDPIGFSQLRFR